MSSSQITLSWNRKAMFKGSEIGSWQQTLISETRTAFRGKLRGSRHSWSPWMTKKELREWLEEQIKKQG